MILTSTNELKIKDKTLKGKWTLGRGNEIRYKESGKKRELLLAGRILEGSSGALILTGTWKSAGGVSHTKIFTLRGHWRSNARNELIFDIAQKRGRKQELLFKGQWRLNTNQQITYGLTRRKLKRSVKVERFFTLKGYFDITENGRLTYFLKGSGNDTLRFRGAFQSKSILAKKGAIRYQLGVEVKKQVRQNVLTLFGKWKASRKLDLGFEMSYGGRQKRSIHFKSTYHIDEKRRLIMTLKSASGKRLGPEIVFARELTRSGGNAFVGLYSVGASSGIQAGMAFRS